MQTKVNNLIFTMKFTDACIHPYPSGDSSIRRMALEAAELGFDSCVVVNDIQLPSSDIKLLKGSVITGASIKNVIAGLRKIPDRGDLVFVDARDSSFNRSVLSLNRIHVLRGVGKDPNQIIDHVGARLAAKRGIALDIDLHPVIHSREERRQQVLHRYEDLIQLQRRFHFPLTISTNASSILDQRSVREITLLCSLFGMERKEVYNALATPESFITRKKIVEVVG